MPRMRVVALAGALSAAVVAAFALTGGSDSGVPQATASPLAQLSAFVSQSPPATGDATLVQRHHTFADGSTMTGADLYLDNGTCYYAPTANGLSAAITGHETESCGPTNRAEAVAVAALNLPIGQARIRMANSAIDPHAKNLAGTASARAQARLKNAHVKPITMTHAQLIDGRVWSSSMGVLLAGAGQNTVRAGVLRLLASIPTVTVQRVTVDGHRALSLHDRVFPDGYSEGIVIDARTGSPLRFVGGYPHHTPAVVMTFKVTRVTAADLAKQ
jgi:hypothetical protein